MRVVILAGGLGSRLAEETSERPKPMVEIGGKPIIWHIMNIYAAGGINEFCIACGYKGEVIKEYFANFHLHLADISVDMVNGNVEFHNSRAPDLRLHLIDTGVQTQTGGRLLRMKPWLSETFMMTYGDGVADVDVRELLQFHRSHGKLATITAVRPPARFGGLRFEGNRVAEFIEKPQIGEGWINGGFMVLEPAVLDYIHGDDCIFEREPLERLAVEGELMAYRHEGFWQPMDTLREKHLLEEFWRSGQAPWKVWSD
ncbi:glucose-1-phosphate cytidylyltransferase [Candidatus Parcubacteria bacterium]|nr:MAG: glucose-1-phosphate cytidylyltransferase [Candidatus Parcubacteria bacterium]